MAAGKWASLDAAPETVLITTGRYSHNTAVKPPFFLFVFPMGIKQQQCRHQPLERDRRQSVHPSFFFFASLSKHFVLALQQMRRFRTPGLGYTAYIIEIVKVGLRCF